MAELGTELSARIGRVIPVLPVSLVASVFVASGAPLSMTGVRAAAAEMLDRLHAAGAHSHIPRGSFDYTVEVGMRMLTLRGIVTEAEDLYTAAPEETGLLRYYANAIAHLLPEKAD